MESMYRGVAPENEKKKRWSKNMESITTNPTLQGSVRMSLRWKSSTKQNLRKVCRRSLLMKMVISCSALKMGVRRFGKECYNHSCNDK